MQHSQINTAQMIEELRGRAATQIQLQEKALIVIFDGGERLTFWFNEAPIVELETPDRTPDS